MSDITIGKLARRVNVSVETIRYYERRGLLPTPGRTRSGYRLYDADAVDRLRFIRRARAMAFSLDEVARLIALRRDGDDPRTAIVAMARTRAAHLDARIAEMQSARRRLARLIEGCERSADGAADFLGALPTEAAVAESP